MTLSYWPFHVAAFQLCLRSLVRSDAPLDVSVCASSAFRVARKMAFGAIASGGLRVINKEVLEDLAIPAEWVEAIDAKERRQLERRERVYRGELPPPQLTGRTVIPVDDGLATGATMLAAVRAIRMDDPAKIIVAVPVADPQVCRALGAEADGIVCMLTPDGLVAVGDWYEDFSQTTDEEVRDLLARTRRPPIARPPRPTHALTGEITDYDWLIEPALGARYVLIGEASHGTEEFYRERAQITKRLIAEAGFTAVAVEAAWPMRTGSTDTCAARPTTAARTRRYVTSVAFPSGCGATPRSPNSSPFCVSGTMRRGRALRRWASTGSTSTACTARWRPVVEFLVDASGSTS